MNRHRSHFSVFILLTLVLLASACAGPAPVVPTAEPPAPTAEPPQATATAIPPTPQPTPVPPTETPAPTEVPTADPAVIAATEAAQAEAEAIAAIEPDLTAYGLSTEEGSLGWVYDPVTIELTKYLEAQSVIDDPGLSAADFVIQSDITWNSTSGLAACGFVLRGDPQSGTEYEFIVVRMSGVPGWTLWFYEDGQFMSDVAGTRETQTLDIGQGSTNKIAVVGQGSQFTTYINGQNAGQVSHAGLHEGSMGLLARQESGTTTCAFENSWLWVLDN